MFRLILIIAFMAGTTAAQEPDFTLSSPVALVDSGFLGFVLPRFSLKTGVRAEILPDTEPADISLNTQSGVPVMQGLGQQYFMMVEGQNTAQPQNAQRFADWLVSEIGKRTIEQFTLDGAQVFTASRVEVQGVAPIIFEGDAKRGEALSFTNCGRCHVIDPRNPMSGIGSTPSFGLIRGLPDWDERFMTFYLRAPHPAITQIEGITDPFDPARPVSIFPLSITQTEMEDILTYVSTIKPVNLGAPLVEHQ
ncbi:MAG: hypothetical protein L3J33_10980 [Rhodobacteraceae bacterium]|nr:hypothetical protein [Paracoccaceae bacterium]